MIDALPLTVNGKLDIRALPAPEHRDVDRYRAPVTAIEETLAGIYAHVLGVERVGVDDSFFDLGGDSILSMQVVAQARAAGVLCRPRDIFVEQTVARLALVATVAAGESGVADEGIGPVVATPIMRWLQTRGRSGRAVQPDDGGASAGRGDRGRRAGGAAGVSWIATPCCGYASTTTAPGSGPYGCPSPGRWRPARA